MNFLEVLKRKQKEQEKEIEKLNPVFTDLENITKMLFAENEKIINKGLTQL